MKRILLLLLTLAFFVSCEDVIEIELPTETPRLTVDAIIRIDTTQNFTTASIRIGLSSSFFDENQTTEIEQVMILNPDYVPLGPLDANFILFSETDPGIYEGTKNTGFFTSGELQLYIEVDEEVYYANTRYVSSVPIDSLEQGNETLFSGDEKEVIVTFTDKENRDDFYILDFDFNQYLVTEDEFYQGQAFVFSYFYDIDLQLDADSTINISLLGADESFYNYMNQIIVQSGGDQGPFQTPAATVRGNVFNVTGIENIEVLDNVESSDNFALGYFAVVQEYKKSIVLENEEN
ncbi:DUF4249 family protein [Maribacter sp. ACAM166]|uniref:DUF4249 family protein n=1 Tax=Maribacter sp. ACAM166 TaxID=2508996 RepID=UPI0010FD9E56|nr:DUF4249 family protein [Maribacter sp. ACAM166]TLP81245.1 DUF4249 family protein [Maribacter sp. ACAM166]